MKKMWLSFFFFVQGFLCFFLVCRGDAWIQDGGGGVVERDDIWLFWKYLRTNWLLTYLSIAFIDKQAVSLVLYDVMHEIKKSQKQRKKNTKNQYVCQCMSHIKQEQIASVSLAYHGQSQ